MWSLNQLYVYVQERMKECLTLTYISFHILTKILYVFLLITDYLVGLTFWAFSIGFWYVTWSGTKKEQIRLRHIYKVMNEDCHFINYYILILEYPI